MPGTIMIVEDEPAVARGVQVALEREGYAVTVQPTGEDAVANFADAAPDLVVLDVRLPGIDGFEVLRRCAARRARRSSSSPPAPTRSTRWSVSRWAPTTTSSSRSASASW